MYIFFYPSRNQYIQISQNQKYKLIRFCCFSGVLDHPYVRDGGVELPGGTRSFHGQSVQWLSQVHVHSRFKEAE